MKTPEGVEALSEASESESKAELFAEEKERFSALFAELKDGFRELGFPYGNFEKVFELYWSGYKLEAKEKLVDLRKKRFEALQEPDFRFFIEEEIARICKLPTQEVEGEIYNAVRIYTMLPYENRELFLADILGEPSIWRGFDGSNMRGILNFLKERRNPDTKEAVLRHIRHIFSPDYGRAQYWKSDLYPAVSALHAILSDSEFQEMIEKMAHEEKSFERWFEEHKLEGMYFGSPPKKEPETFDPEKEAETIKNYEALLSTYEADANIVFPEDENDEDEKEEDSLESDEHKGPPLINFYGRFIPDHKNLVEIGGGNYLPALVDAALREGDEEIRTRFNFLSGFGSKEQEGSQLPPRMHFHEFHQITKLAFARALTLARFGKNKEQASAELAQVRQYISQTYSEDNKDPFLQILQDAENYVTNVQEKEETLPESADSFLLYHAKYQRAKEIPDFRTLLAEKMNWAAASYLPKATLDDLKNLFQAYEENIKLYRDVEKSDVPLYWEAKEKLEDFSENRNVVFGRDGRFFFTALKAGDFGLGEKELKYVIVTRYMTEDEPRETIQRYLKQNGVGLDFMFIDTGYQGTIPEFAIHLLADEQGIELPQDEINRKIKLLSSSHSKRAELSYRSRSRGAERHSRVDDIEERPQPYHSPNRLELSPSGKLRPLKQAYNIGEQLKAWTVEHAVFRNFAPRLDGEKKVRYLKEDPLKGYEYLYDLSGKSISTHPMEIWENQEGKKVLVKGGPDHTVRADFVGSQFLEHVGVKTPKTELMLTREGPRLKMEYLEGFDSGGIELPEDVSKVQILEGFLVDMLLGQYDRTPWNLMFDRHGNAAFIDNGGSLFSRARGGFKGFSDKFTADELESLLENPQFPGKPVNEVYHNLVAVENGEVHVKQRQTMNQLLDGFDISFEFIDNVIDQAGFTDGRRSIAVLEKRIEQLEKGLLYMHKESVDYKKTQAAVQTFQDMIAAGGEASYLKMALKQRYHDIRALFHE